jgi:hypothetical protein
MGQTSTNGTEFQSQEQESQGKLSNDLASSKEHNQKTRGTGKELG